MVLLKKQSKFKLKKSFLTISCKYFQKSLILIMVDCGWMFNILKSATSFNKAKNVIGNNNISIGKCERGRPHQ